MIDKSIIIYLFIDLLTRYAIKFSSDREQMPPFILFKGTRDGRKSRQLAIIPPNEFPVSVKYSCQARAWVHQAVFLNWIEQVWKPWTQGFLGEPTYLLMGDFLVHKVGKCVDAINIVALRSTI